MKCDELKVHKAYNRWIDEEKPTPNDDLICNEVYLKSEVDSVIDELKTENESLLQQNRELCLALQVMYSKEEYDKQKAENAELKQKLQDQCISCPVKMQEDDVVAELKQKLEDAKATAYAESVDAGMRERRLKRALYKAYANWARTAAMSFWNRWEDVNFRKWQKVKRKCLKKAEEYK